MTPKTLPEILNLHERLIIIKTLQQHGFSRATAAKVLGISRMSLWRRMRRLGIDLKVVPRTSPGRPRVKVSTS